MLSETIYTGITNLYVITKNQQNIKQYIINVNSVFWRAQFLASFWKCLRYCSREARLLIVRSIDEVRQLQTLSQSIYLIFDVAPQVNSLYVMSGLVWLDYTWT